MKSISIFTFIDAFGWEILQQHHFMDDFLTTKAPLGTVLGYSSTCIPTILTGKMPYEHRHLSFFKYDPENSPFSLCRCLSILPDSITRRGRVRRMMSKVIQKFYGYTGYFQIYNLPFDYLPLFDYSEKRDLYQTGGINDGSPTIFDKLRERNIPFYLSDWRAKEADNLLALERAIDNGGVTFAYVYLAAMDAILHAHGTEAPIVEEKIQWYDRNLRRIVKLAEQKYSQVNLYIFSDHGMTNTTDECNLMARIDKLGLKFGEDYAAMYDSTMARFWFLNDTARTKIIQALQEEPRGRILRENDLNEYGCNFANHEYGDLFFLTNPGVLINPSFMGEARLAGMHGYDALDKDSIAMLASNVSPARMPQRLDGLFQLMKMSVPDLD
ncbi:MAG: alkaline phosphatase family protein [Acidobacteriota bacterium]